MKTFTSGSVRMLLVLSVIFCCGRAAWADMTAEEAFHNFQIVLGKATKLHDVARFYDEGQLVLLQQQHTTLWQLQDIYLDLHVVKRAEADDGIELELIGPSHDKKHRLRGWVTLAVVGGLWKIVQSDAALAAPGQ